MTLRPNDTRRFSCPFRDRSVMAGQPIEMEDDEGPSTSDDPVHRFSPATGSQRDELIVAGYREVDIENWPIETDEEMTAQVREQLQQFEKELREQGIHL